ncbi:MAG: hypothetical protein AAGG75_20200 [Bacteroidota bacterium]
MARRVNLAHLYNPQILEKDELTENFVVRLDIFKRLYQEISTVGMKYPEQHYVIQGNQGTGKTTLLLRLSYAVENDPSLRDWLVPIVFNEEEYGIRRLYKLWLRLAELLGEKQECFRNLGEVMKELSQQFPEDDEFERAAFKLLSDSLHREQKKIILFIDNFGDMLSKFNKDEAHRLRKILQTSADLRIFAASSRTIEAFHDYKHPFYEFFKIEYLKGLNHEQTEELLLKLGERYQLKDFTSTLQQQRGRIEVMRRLTGGVIRQMVILFEVLVKEKNTDAFELLECLLDRSTPLYKNRMDKLPPQQQEIVEAIAHRWDAVSVKEISERTRMGSKIISAQLNQLVKSEVVFKIHTTTKNHLYRIKDRFFNIWYLVRLARNGSIGRVQRLVNFLDYWCSRPAVGPDSDSTAPASADYFNQYLPQLADSDTALSQVLPQLCPEIMGLMAQQQYPPLLAFFNAQDAQGRSIADQLKPLYYALMQERKEEFPNEYLRMGEELESTVEEILVQVQSQQARRA